MAITLQQHVIKSSLRREDVEYMPRTCYDERNSDYANSAFSEEKEENSSTSTENYNVIESMEGKIIGSNTNNEEEKSIDYAVCNRDNKKEVEMPNIEE